ncbi:MAG TPA: ATPase, partial [Sphingomicrobium sp.]|nr:ATPase [Sphingomicrobium sp.]
MPQLSQLSEVYLSQLLWLAIALAFIFFVIARGMVPKIQATV